MRLLCPHCSEPVKFSVFGSFRKSYTCPGCRTTLQAKVGLIGFAIILITPGCITAVATETTIRALRMLGVDPVSIEPIPTLLIQGFIVLLSLFFSACIASPLIHRTRTLSQLPKTFSSNPQ